MTIMTDVAGRARRVLHAFATGDGRQLRSYAHRLGLSPELAYPIASTIKLVRNPARAARYKQSMSLMNRRPELTGIFNKKTGWGRIASGTIPGIEPVVATLRKLRDEYRVKPAQDDYYIKTILRPEDLNAHREVLDFVLSKELIQIAGEYLGSVPVLKTVQGWWTPRNETTVSSQLFHVDNVDYCQAKFFFNMEDLESRDGPFSFIPADISKRVLKNLPNWRRRIEDDEVFQFCEPADVIETKGPTGSGFAVDGCRCLHFGGRARDGERLVLMVSFGRHLCPMEAAVGITPQPDWYRNDTLRGMVLGAV